MAEQVPRRPEGSLTQEVRIAALEDRITSLEQVVAKLHATQAELLEELRRRNGATVEDVQALGGTALTAEAQAAKADDVERPTEVKPVVRALAQDPTATAVSAEKPQAAQPATPESKGSWFRRNGARILGIGALAAAGYGSAVALASEKGGDSGTSTPAYTATAGSRSTVSTTETSPTATTSPETTSTKAKKPPTSPEKRNVGKSRNIATAVAKLDVSSPKVRRDVLEKYMGKNIHLELNNIHNKMNAMPNGTTKDEALVAIGLAAASDNKEGNHFGKGMINFNTKFNRSIDASTGMSLKEQEAFNKKFMTKKGKTFVDPHFSGWVENGFMHDGGELQAQMQYFNDVPVLVREVPGMGRVMYKVERDSDGHICLNLVRRVPAPRTPATSVTPSGGPGVGQPTPNRETTQDQGRGRIPDRKITHSGGSGGGSHQTQPNTGKHAEQSPVSSNPNDPVQAKRPNIPAPVVAIQPEGAPAVDPYVPSKTVEDPRPAGSEGTPTPVSTETVPAGSTVTGP